MTTSRFLLIAFAVLVLLSGVALIWRPHKELGGKTSLIWVSDNNPARRLQIDTFNQENPDLNLELDFGNGGSQKIILQSSSGVGPDIFDFSSDEIGTYVESGVLLDVTDQAGQMGFSAKTDLWPSGQNTVTYLGRQYGYPCNIGCLILIYNKNLFDYLGIPYPEYSLTWQQFEELGRKINEALRATPSNANNKIYPVSGVNWRLVFDSLKGEYFDEKGGLNIRDNPELLHAFEQHHRYLFKDHLMPSELEAKALSGQGGFGGGNLNQFASGRFAMIATGYWALISFNLAYQNQTDYLKKKGVKIDEILNPLERPLRLGASLLPYEAGQSPVYRVSARVAGINAKSPRSEEALKFLKYLANPSYSKLLNEGEDYLPGNPKYANLGVEPGEPDLARVQLQNTTEDAMNHGYQIRESPFILAGEVSRVLANQAKRMESDPNIPIPNLLESADRELKVSLFRNLQRNPDLKKLYIERFGEMNFQNLK